MTKTLIFSLNLFLLAYIVHGQDKASFLQSGSGGAGGNAYSHSGPAVGGKGGNGGDIDVNDFDFNSNSWFGGNSSLLNAETGKGGDGGNARSEHGPAFGGDGGDGGDFKGNSVNVGGGSRSWPYGGNDKSFSNLNGGDGGDGGNAVSFSGPAVGGNGGTGGGIETNDTDIGNGGFSNPFCYPYCGAGGDLDAKILKSGKGGDGGAAKSKTGPAFGGHGGSGGDIEVNSTQVHGSPCGCGGVGGGDDFLMAESGDGGAGGAAMSRDGPAFGGNGGDAGDIRVVSLGVDTCCCSFGGCRSTRRRCFYKSWCSGCLNC